MTVQTPPDIRPVLFEKHNADAAYREDLGHTKRLIERWYSDDEFRRQLLADPQGTAARNNLVRDPEEARILWDPEFIRAARENHGKPGYQAPHYSLSVRRHLAYTREKIASRTRYRAKGTPLDARFATWRTRMMARCVSHLGGLKSEYLIHAPVCFELTKGCSVGCWFCSVSAPRLSEQWLYTPANARLWRDTLEVFRDLYGPAAGMGFCYWASDPLDNPDYEHYLVDFHDLLGEFPQTTTAQAQKHVERVLALLRLSESKNGFIERFSILTLKQWSQIHEAFKPADLTFVECIPQNKEVLGGDNKSISGRARDRHLSRVAKNLELPREEDLNSTTACVSGFLVNMIDRTVRLITPCHASDRWPLGYWVVDHGTFSDAISLRNLLERLVSDNMPSELGREAPVRVRSDLKFESVEDGFELSTRYWRHSVRRSPQMRQLGLLLQEGRPKAEMALELLDSCGMPIEETFSILDELFERGLLDEEPAGAQNTLGEWLPNPQAKA